MKLIIFFHAAARKTIINCLVTTQHRPTPYEVELPLCFIIDSKCEKKETAISKSIKQYKIDDILFQIRH